MSLINKNQNPRERLVYSFKKFIAQHDRFYNPILDSIVDGSNLFDLGFDSFDIVNLIVFLEDDLSINIMDEDINIRDFSSIETILNLLLRINKSNHSTTSKGFGYA
ncbi:phosphopantetheine-binding protein [Photorhabdus temperata]|uniref:Acyl carrier protein n=1 Tax=Photorhabdus temperata subsp. temperata Meg1 TaxID=1393735 RepID=A0A081RZK0_PHOTE|nr:phosphopantetheine-binding protein [Photorhabdus temperata]KER04103.1 acyl carrier protein [Photorhabdus temperata subsp. temperata Meg1]MCT8349351.1 phosphopantetheine-binding protein [Photorhabdus temperata]